MATAAPSGGDIRADAAVHLRGRVREIARTRARVARRVVGREHELDLILAAVAAGRDLLLEGPPGASKSTLLRAIAAEWGIPVLFVEGNVDLTPAKLIGHHDPARVLQEGYRVDNFVDGPLVKAMRLGGFLYIEEFNRAPDDTRNALLTAMAEREIEIPRVGHLSAASTFRVVATMNPHDNVGTTRLSSSVTDRFNRVAVTYQDAADELRIVALRAPLADGDLPAELARALRADAVDLTRATRAHPDVRQGSSVRGAIDLTLVGANLMAMRGVSEAGGARLDHDPARQSYAATVLDAMTVALSGRIHLDEAVQTTPEAVLREIWEDHFLLNPAAAKPG
ncbi:MoxR family ATPase [Intrasporangium sp.]|uniref:AAA family ATPase n=1 Tax=Intrasporangium sp. TaxID=1925024 RepID=UPI003221C49F